MKRTMQIMSAIGAILLGSVSAPVLGEHSTKAIEEKEQAALFPSAQMIEMGRAVADNTCASCHGMDGMSTRENQPHLAGQRTIYLYRVLQDYQSGERADDSMQHASKFLSDEALLAVSAYYASLISIREASALAATEESELLGADPFTGIRKEIKKCTRCHGVTGNSTASGMPNLTAQDPEYFIVSMKAYADGDRNHKLMKRLVSKLDDQITREMSIFYAVQQPERTETQGEGDAEAGRRLAEECASCHGGDGNASGKNMPTLAGQDARYFIKAMNAYKDGKRQHKSMREAAEGLNEENLKDLATFYADQEPIKRNVRMPLKTIEWIARCDRCHGINGNSTDPRFPMLAGQNASYLRSVMQAYTGGSRSRSIMHKMSSPLSGTDIERMVSHYSSQEPKSVVYIQLPCPKTDD